MYFSALVGKKLNAFLDHVRTEYRLPIAHLSLDDYENMLLDPGSVKIDHRIDWTVAVLFPMVRQMLQDEWQLMDTHGLP